MKTMLRLARITGAMLAIVLSSGVAAASDADVLTGLLSDFLAKAHTKAAHQLFWADDLVYTSSAGLRFGKTDILAGFEVDAASDAVPDTVYSAEETDIRVYGDTAIIAFKLVGSPADRAQDGRVDYYFNTGTFLRRDGRWQAVAWQATKIPDPE